MSINAVQQYLRSQLDGLAVAGMTAEAHVQPPIVDDIAANPQIYVWGSKLHETRYTMPRPTGDKFLRHEPDVWVTLAMSADDPNIDTTFPAVIDAIMATLRTATLGVTLTDPVTGGTSILQNIGEEMTVEYTTPQALADQRLVLFGAVIVAIADEFTVG